MNTSPAATVFYELHHLAATFHANHIQLLSLARESIQIESTSFYSPTLEINQPAAPSLIGLIFPQGEILHPDQRTAFRDPLAIQSTVSVLCDRGYGCPRAICRTAGKELGIDGIIYDRLAFNLEYQLVISPPPGALAPSAASTAVVSSTMSYNYTDLAAETVEYLEKAGINIIAYRAVGSIVILTLLVADWLELGDAIVKSRYITAAIAASYNLRCNFDLPPHLSPPSIPQPSSASITITTDAADKTILLHNLNLAKLHPYRIRDYLPKQLICHPNRQL